MSAEIAELKQIEQTKVEKMSAEIAELKKQIEKLKEKKSTQIKPEYLVIDCTPNDVQIKSKKRPGRRLMTFEGRDKKKKVQCSVCNKALSDNSSLKKHIQSVHLDITKIKCDLCVKQFSTKQQFKNHRRGKYCFKK